MDPTQKLPPKPFINNTQKILQCMQAEVQPSDHLQWRGDLLKQEKRDPGGPQPILKMKSEFN